MPVTYDPDQERFDDTDCAAAFLAAVTQLAHDTDQLIDDFRGRPLSEIGLLAKDTYGADLPEFWQVWCSWHEPGPTPEMGDL